MSRGEDIRQMLREITNEGGAYSGSFDVVRSPLEREVKDIERAKQFAYTKYPIMPFFDRSDASLEFMKYLRLFAPTHSGILGSIKRFTTGGGVEFVRRAAHGWRGGLTGDQIVSPTEVSQAIEYLAEVGISGHTMEYVVDSIYENFQPYGNAFIEVALTETDGQKGASIHCHDVHRCRYFIDDTDPFSTPKVVLLSKLWNYEYLTRYTPHAIPLYPLYTEDENGTRRTMIHLKNKVSDYDWYGVPEWIGGLYYAFNELQLGQYQTEGYAKDFIGRVFFEIDGTYPEFSPDDLEDPNTPSSNEMLQIDQGFVEDLRRVFTNEGGADSKRSILLRAREPESNPTSIHEFTPNMGEQFHKITAEIDEKQLFKAHQWHPMLMVAIAGKLGSSKDELVEMIAYKQLTVVEPLQSRICRGLNLALDIIGEWTGGNEMSTVGFGFRNVADQLIEKIRGDKDQQPPPAAPPPQAPPF